MILLKLLLAISCLNTSSVHLQSDLDQGIGKLHIGATRKSIETYLQLLESPWSHAYSEVSENGIYSSAWLFDYKKAGNLTYGGLTVARIEVFLGWNDQYDDMGEPVGE